MHKPSIFYGYKIATAGFVIQAIGIGTFVAFGVFFKPMLAEFGWSRAALSGAQSLAIFSSGLLGILIGRLSDRYGPRLLMSVSGFCFGLGLLLISGLNELWQLYLFYGLLVGIGMSSVMILPLTSIARWFARRRGAISGIVKAGTGVGQFAIPLVAGLLVISVGWRNSYIIIGATVMIVLIAAAQILRRNPESMGLQVDGNSVSQTVHLSPQESGFSIHEGICSRQFWMIIFSVFTARFCMMSIMVHIIPHATDIGISLTIAASILATIGAVSIAGRIAVGYLTDRIGSRYSLAICLLMLISNMVFIQWVTDLWMFYLFAVVFGLTLGGITTTPSLLVADYFGLRSHGALYGIVLFGGGVGAAAGSIITGLIFDITGSYSLAFWFLTAIAIVSLLLILPTGKPKAAVV
ncbi:MFS transporter [Chloroflexota bacterium]